MVPKNLESRRLPSRIMVPALIFSEGRVSKQSISKKPRPAGAALKDHLFFVWFRMIGSD